MKTFNELKEEFYTIPTISILTINSNKTDIDNESARLSYLTNIINEMYQLNKLQLLSYKQLKETIKFYKEVSIQNFNLQILLINIQINLLDKKEGTSYLLESMYKEIQELKIKIDIFK